MSHMVIFRTPEGKPGYQPAETVEDAVGVVERLRNEDGVENVRIFRLEELAFEYRPYYKVELAGASGGPPSTPTQVFSVPSPSDRTDADGEAGEAEHAEQHAEHAEDSLVSDDAAGDESDTFDAPSNEAPAQPPWAAPPPPAPVIDQPAEVGGFGEGRDESDDSGEFSGQRRGLFGR